MFTRDHGNPVGQGFSDDDAEVLVLAGEQEYVGVLEDSSLGLSRHFADETYAVIKRMFSGQALEVRELAPGSRDHELCRDPHGPELAQGKDRNIDPLLLGKPAECEKTKRRRHLAESRSADHGGAYSADSGSHTGKNDRGLLGFSAGSDCQGSHCATHEGADCPAEPGLLHALLRALVGRQRAVWHEDHGFAEEECRDQYQGNPRQVEPVDDHHVVLAQSTDGRCQRDQLGVVVVGSPAELTRAGAAIARPRA